MSYMKPGEELSLSAHVYRSEKSPRVAELVSLPVAELDTLEGQSIEREKAIYAQIDALVTQWCQQARETVSIQNAKAWQRTPAVKHTSNEWTMFDTFRHEKSNMVYKMVWWVNERTLYNRALKKSEIVAWDLRWYICYNSPQNVDVTGSGWQIAGQDNKVFKEKAAMEKYLQGRIAAYAHLFTEISPPIPYGEQGRFSVNGVLLPGYTVEAPERTPQEVAAELLDFLDEDDTLSAPAQSPPPKPAKAAERKKPVPKKSGLVR